MEELHEDPRTIADLKRQREANLKTLWAQAYDAWTKVPGADSEAIYLKPTTGGTASDDDTDLSEASDQLALPPVVSSCVIFALNAQNPLGIQWSADANARANQQLKPEVERMSAPKPKSWWNGYSFNDSWREDGFVLAFNKKDAEKARKAVVDLGKKYGQAAVYEYLMAEDSSALTRTTLPCLVKNVEATTTVTRCVKPEF